MSYDQFALICASIDMAKYEIQMLDKNRICPYVASVIRCKADHRLGVALIEQVHPYVIAHNTAA